jgi:hypothetical protein
MAECDCLAGCPFFNDKMPDTSGLGAMYKKRYCLGDYISCARHAVKEALGKPSVPADLYPNMHDRAEELLGAH